MIILRYGKQSKTFNYWLEETPRKKLNSTQIYNLIGKIDKVVDGKTREDITEEVLNRVKTFILSNRKKRRYTTGEKINLFDNIEVKTLKKFNALFNKEVKGNDTDIVEILEPYANDGRVITVNGKRQYVFFDKYLSDNQILTKLKEERVKYGELSAHCAITKYLES